MVVSCGLYSYAGFSARRRASETVSPETFAFQLLRDAVLATEFSGFCAGLGFLQYGDDLFFSESSLLRGPLLSVTGLYLDSRLKIGEQIMCASTGYLSHKYVSYRVPDKAFLTSS